MGAEQARTWRRPSWIATCAKGAAGTPRWWDPPAGTPTPSSPSSPTGGAMRSPSRPSVAPAGRPTYAELAVLTTRVGNAPLEPGFGPHPRVLLALAASVEFVAT